MSKAYQAHAPGGFSLTAETPQKAALAFFVRFPNKRKCSVIEGETSTTDGCRFFTVKYGRKSLGEWPTSWRDVNKKTAINLPDGVPT